MGSYKEEDRPILEQIGRWLQRDKKKSKKPAATKSPRTEALKSNLGRSVRDIDEWRRKGPRRRTGKDPVYYNRGDK